MQPDALNQLIDDYCAAWSEADPAARARKLAQALDRNARYTDPRVDCSNIEQLGAHIGALLAKRPGARVVRTSAVDAHHGLARFAWRVIEADGTLLPEGIDFVELSAEHKLSRIVGFFGPLGARTGA